MLLQGRKKKDNYAITTMKNITYNFICRMRIHV